jgi:hypothetical protein
VVLAAPQLKHIFKGLGDWGYRGCAGGLAARCRMISSIRHVIHFLEATGGVIFILWCLLTIIVGIIQTCKGKSLWDTPPAVEMILAYGWLAWVSLFAFVVIPYWVLTKMFGLSLP